VEIEARVNLTEAKFLLKRKFNNILKGQRSRPMLILGHKGIGKTQSSEQLAIELTSELKKNVKVLYSDLQFKERPDFMGLMHIDPVTGRSRCATPEDFPTGDDSYGIIIFDEANRVEDRGMRSGLLTMIESRRINNERLGKNWMMVFLGNPPGDKYEGVQEFDTSLTDRLSVVHIVPTFHEIYNYLKKKWSNHALIPFLEENPEFISLDGGNITPRTFEYVLEETQDLLMKDRPIQINDQLRLILEAEVGQGGAQVITAYLRGTKIPTYEQISSGDEESIQWVKENQTRNDAISQINKAFLTDYKSHVDKEKKFPAASKENIVKYFEAILNEQRLAVIHDADVMGIGSQFMQDFIMSQPYFEDIFNVLTAHRGAEEKA